MARASLSTRFAWARAARRIKKAYRHLPEKQHAEARFWALQVIQLQKWYLGVVGPCYGSPNPTEADRVTGYDLRTNALLTWIRCRRNKYPDRLRLDRGALAGRRVLDVGSGPIPHLLAFDNCERFGVDQLVTEYREMGWPLDHFAGEMQYLRGDAEHIPAEDAAFDVVVAVNSLDHVDDFAATAREICRVLRPGGLLRIQLHYHSATRCEPQELNDEIVLAHFGHLGVEKLYSEAPPHHEEGTVNLWSTPL